MEIKIQKYNRKSLVEAYIEVQRKHHRHPDFRKYHQRLVDTLEKLYGIKIDGEEFRKDMRKDLIWILFQDTINSYLRIPHPLDGYLEATLLHSSLDEVGQPGAAANESLIQIATQVKKMKTLHTELLDHIFVCLWGDIQSEYTSEQLLQHGFDDKKNPIYGNYDYD